MRIVEKPVPFDARMARRGVITFAAMMLSGCENETLTVELHDPQREELAKAPPVKLPPAIQASRTYRCKDSGLLYVDFYTNGSARVSVGSREATSVGLSKSANGAGFEGDGYSVSGNEGSISFTTPGEGSQSCKS